MMNGQWLGGYDGTTPGYIVLDLDDLGTHYEGVAVAYDDRTQVPSTFVRLRTIDKSTSFVLRDVPVQPIDPLTGDPSTWAALSPRFPGVTFPTTVEIHGDLRDDVLSVNWTTDIQTIGNANLPRSRAGEPSELIARPEVTDWKSFVRFITQLPHRKYIFRGQSSPRRLRTSFHRELRADLMRYMSIDIKTLHRHLSLRTSHIFDLTNPDQNGAFFNLAQHHGYPTPLLDWTYSPYVAAFFAYRSLRNQSLESRLLNARIFMLDQEAWVRDKAQSLKLSPTRPHFSLMEFIAIDNPRTIPQQSVSSVTNVDDIEGHIRVNEQFPGQYLKVLDLPRSQRTEVMPILSSMGVTAGSLFPGLDGACEELRERFFGS